MRKYGLSDFAAKLKVMILRMSINIQWKLLSDSVLEHTAGRYVWYCCRGGHTHIISVHAFELKEKCNCDTCRKAATSTFAVRNNTNQAGPSNVRAKDVVPQDRQSKRDSLLFTYNDVQFYVYAKLEVLGFKHVFSTNVLDVTKYNFGLSVDRIFGVNNGNFTYKPNTYSVEEKTAVDIKHLFAMVKRFADLENIIQEERFFQIDVNICLPIQRHVRSCAMRNHALLNAWKISFGSCGRSTHESKFC